MNQYQLRIQELEQELREVRVAAAAAEQCLTTLADFLPEAIMLYNDEDVVVFINNQWCELMGLPGPARQWLGKTSAEMLPVLQALLVDAESFAAWVQEAWAVDVPLLNTELLLRNGRCLEVRYVPVRNGNPVSRRRLVCLRDVTQHREDARQLNEQRNFYETILDFLPGEVVIYDTEQRYRYVNARSISDPAVRTWLIGKTDADFVAHRHHNPEVAVRRKQQLEEVLVSGEAVWEEAFQLPDGTMRHMFRHLRAVRDEDGQARMIIGYGTNITQRYKAEQHMWALFAALPDTILVLNADGQVQDAKLGDTLLLLPESRLVGAALTELLPAAAQAQLQPCLAKVRATGQPGACTFELPGLAGAVTFHAARVVALSDPQTVLVILQNITTQEVVQRKLAAREEFIRQVIDASPDLVYVRDEAGQVVLSNKAFDDFAQRIRHVDLAQGRVTEKEDSPVRQELARINSSHEYVLATGNEVSYEASFTMLDGTVRWFHVIKRLFMRSNGQRNVLSVSTDVTDIKQARQRLENSEKRLRDLVHYSQGLICTHDLEGNMLAVNPAVERLLNIPAERLLGRNLREVIPPEHQHNFAAYLAGFDQQPGQRSVMAILTSAGKRYVHYNNYRVMEPGQEPYVVASAYDITEGVLNERALRQAKHEVEESGRAKDNFLASMSHEIRTPLNGVLGMAALLAKTQLDSTQRELIDTINYSGQHLLAVVNDVLDMAKITAGLLQLEHSAFDLWASVQGAVQTMTYLAEEKDLYLSMMPLRMPPPVVLGDSRRLNQVLLNLLNNATKFTERGSVTLGGDVLADSPEEITIRFWIRDTGIGIPQDKQRQIFDTFAQASTDTARRFGGTGLGLSISQYLVQLMGGTLTVESEENKGSVFAFTISLPRAATAPVQPPQKKEWPELTGLRILLAEDNPVNQRLCMLMLEPQGVQLDCASNGPEALVLFNEHLYDLVLMDIQMPGMSGVEVTQRIREHSDLYRAGTPVIALTANALRRDQERYLAAGMNACLIKPFEERYLHQTILNVLNGGGPVIVPAAVPPVATATSAAAASLYSLSFLEASSNGNPDFVQRMVQVFLKETPAQIAALDQAAAAADWGTVRKVAHSIKPAVVMMQIANGPDAIKTLEDPQTTRAAAAAAAQVLSQQLQRACAAMTQALTQQPEAAH